MSAPSVGSRYTHLWLRRTWSGALQHKEKSRRLPPPRLHVRLLALTPASLLLPASLRHGRKRLEGQARAKHRQKHQHHQHHRHKPHQQQSQQRQRQQLPLPRHRQRRYAALARPRPRQTPSPPLWPLPLSPTSARRCTSGPTRTASSPGDGVLSATRSPRPLQPPPFRAAPPLQPALPTAVATLRARPADRAAGLARWPPKDRTAGRQGRAISGPTCRPPTQQPAVRTR